MYIGVQCIFKLLTMWLLYWREFGEVYLKDLKAFYVYVLIKVEAPIAVNANMHNYYPN